MIPDCERAGIRKRSFVCTPNEQTDGSRSRVPVCTRMSDTSLHGRERSRVRSLGSRQDPRRDEVRGAPRRGTTRLLKMSARTRTGRAKIARALYLNNAGRLGIASRRNAFNRTSRPGRAVPSTRTRERGSSKQPVHENKGGRERERQGGRALVCILRRAGPSPLARTRKLRSPFQAASRR